VALDYPLVGRFYVVLLLLFGVVIRSWGSWFKYASIHTLITRDIWSYLISIIIILWAKGSTLDIDASRSGHRGCLDATTIIFFDLEFNLFAIGQRAKAFRLNGRLVDKDILGTIIRDNETESLHGVEPKFVVER
jgi:hypothetical protein